MITKIEIKYDKLGKLSVQNRILQENREKCGVAKHHIWTSASQKINNKIYVGSNINLSKRFVKYFNHGALSKTRMLINLALLKYARSNLRLDVLEYCSIKNVIERDQFYLDNLRPDYNILKQSGSSNGYIHNEASILKISRRTVIFEKKKRSYLGQNDN